MKLVDRRAERIMLDRMVGAVCARESRVLVLWGEPGVGKTALLQHLIGVPPAKSLHQARRPVAPAARPRPDRLTIRSAG
jgi:ABC-type transport system involved in cytochrome c biogenesis ATPase subunit